MGARITTKAHELLAALKRREGHCWPNRSSKPEPPEVVHARKIIEDFERAEDEAWAAKEEQLDRVARWLREQLMFAEPADVLRMLRVYESLTLDDVMKASASMEDHNDPPLGLALLP